MKINQKQINRKISSSLKKYYDKKGRKITKCISCKEITKGTIYCEKCHFFVKNKKLFEKLDIKEQNLQIANKLALEILSEEYFKNKLSLPDIYKKYNIRYNTVFFFFKKNGIKLRNGSKANKLSFENGKLKPVITTNSLFKQEWHTTWYGKNVYLRSSYETIFANFLDQNQIYYEVEKIRVQYIYNNEEHTYISDFYIPDYNLIVETKSDYFLKKEGEVQELKKQAIIDKGYNYFLITDILIGKLKNKKL